MKKIKIVISFDEKGNKLSLPVEPFPENTIYSESNGDELTCYQEGDELPESYTKIKNMFKRANN